MKIHQFKRDFDLDRRVVYSCQCCGLRWYDVGDFEIRYMPKSSAKCWKGKRLSLWQTLKFHWGFYVNCMIEE